MKCYCVVTSSSLLRKSLEANALFIFHALSLYPLFERPDESRRHRISSPPLPIQNRGEVSRFALSRRLFCVQIESERERHARNAKRNTVERKHRLSLPLPSSPPPAPKLGLSEIWQPAASLPSKPVNRDPPPTPPVGANFPVRSASEVPVRDLLPLATTGMAVNCRSADYTVRRPLWQKQRRCRGELGHFLLQFHF